MDSMDLLVKKILTSKVYDVVDVTPLEIMPHLSAKLSGNTDNTENTYKTNNQNNQINIWLKREDLQPIFSFKLRGAYNAIAKLSVEEKQRGIVCASAGNHAQGIAFSCQVLKIKATIVMPTVAPELKVQACKNRGANVVLFGDTFDDANSHANELCANNNMTLVHPFDDLDVIAGQGTIGKEIFEQNQDIDIIFVPIGGGGIASGIAAYIKFVSPKCKIIGVEPEDSKAMFNSIQQGERLKLNQVGGFADGVAVKLVGQNTFELCKKYLDDIVLVSTDEICAAMKDIFDDTRAISEPAGALSVAGAKKYLKTNMNTSTNMNFKNAATILSGANINFDRLRFVAERTEIGEKTEAILAIKIPEEVGSFRRFLEFLGNRKITEFNYRYSTKDSATIFVGINCPKGESEKLIVISDIESAGFEVLDLTDNEIAKSHIRYMIGGKAPSIKHERILCFEFSESPGALKKFLYAIKTHWNITLFHYRNHGADYGSVLVGIEVEKNEVNQVHKFVNTLGYKCVDETDNLAFSLFL